MSLPPRALVPCLLVFAGTSQQQTRRVRSDETPDIIEAHLAHFPLELLKIMGAGASPCTMRFAGVQLLEDVRFDNHFPMYPTRARTGVLAQQWVLERINQARCLREYCAQSEETGNLSHERPAKRQAAERAKTLSTEQARAEARLDSKGRLPRSELTADMREEENETGELNADFLHKNDSDSGEVSKEDSDSDYCA